MEGFDSSGDYLSQFGTAGSGPGQFNAPIAVFDPNSGDAYVADFDNDRVEKFSASLHPTSTALESSNNPSLFGQPVTFTATVSASGGAPAPGGSVSFSDGGTSLGSTTLSGGWPSSRSEPDARFACHYRHLRRRRD